MALPSSPPPLLEPDIPSSPPLPPLTSDSFPAVLRNRKRQLFTYDTSSDPLFSDEASDANGEQPRRKRMVRGPWWRLKQASSQQDLGKRVVKGERSRFKVVDSGVWLGSDESDGSVLPSQYQSDVLQPEVPQLKISDAEARAARTIHLCVDAGNEIVDLSGRELESISCDTLKPLHQLIRPAHAHLKHPPSEDEFAPLTPSLQLFLSRNSLTSLPTELFDLQNLTVLSLRGNGLTTLPPAIGKLQRLKELNIAGNCLQYVPWELADLLTKNCQIVSRPNQFFQPYPLDRRLMLPDDIKYSSRPNLYECLAERRQMVSDQGLGSARTELLLRYWFVEDLRQEQRDQPSLAHLGPHDSFVFLASSAIKFFDTNGLQCRRGTPTCADESMVEVPFPAVLEIQAKPPVSTAASAVSSLFELALRSAEARYNLTPGLWQANDFPPVVNRALRKAGGSDWHDMETQPVPRKDATVYNTAVSNAPIPGMETCSHCSKRFIIARAEWLEYWAIDNAHWELEPQSILPFLRRVCSWDCARETELGVWRR